MSTFVKEACKFVQAMFEPILVDGLSGKVSAEVLDGYIDIWVPVSKRDQRRLEPNYWAFNALIQTLAQVLASELPDGVTSDAIAIRLLPPGTRSRSKLQKARQTQHSHQLPAEILGMTVEELLERFEVCATDLGNTRGQYTTVADIEEPYAPKGTTQTIRICVTHPTYEVKRDNPCLLTAGSRSFDTKIRGIIIDGRKASRGLTQNHTGDVIVDFTNPKYVEAWNSGFRPTTLACKI